MKMYTGHKTTAFDAQVCSTGYKNKGIRREGEIMINVKSWRPAATSGPLLQPSRATRVVFFHFRASCTFMLPLDVVYIFYLRRNHYATSY